VYGLLLFVFEMEFSCCIERLSAAGAGGGYFDLRGFLLQ